ncbi:hypothetical protein Pla108_28170 [Botrimarina colliarenosi]|uniref:Uncharacterized protein n=1 Tax=Botrimarina colliarenosi TaxID=2528001 RepID=A0A5C6AC98_9BACT|nr:Lpg1974 family pore-forming outer membrane protein [Botrimarina colliarenosi]TWT97040.1 hypothetical protein Pla108_28170 [Botrimarina colliarenosi]
MSIFLRGACALLLAAGAASSLNAQTTDRGAVAATFEGSDLLTNPIQQTSCDCGSMDCGDCGEVCDLGCAPCGMGPCGQVFVGGEYLSVRTQFSEATAYREISVTDDLETFHQFNMNYGDSYRLFAGYRLCDCGSEIRFTYTNFNSGGGFASGPNANDADSTLYGPYEAALGDGDELVGYADVNIKNYDIGFSKTIPLGCPLGSPCGDCGDCCDPCCGPVCPAWDITWGGGIRIANVDSSLGYQTVRDPINTAPDRSAVSSVDFDGVGLRFGMTGRRYIGRSGMLSAYIKGDISLLLGDVKYGVAGGPGFTDVSLTTTQVIPVTEIEAGLTGYITQNISVSGGYLLSAWHDLGHRAEYNTAVTPSQIYSMDDANMMTLDGFFLRATAAY